MNDEELEEFRMWADAQPGFLNYERCRDFLANYYDINTSKAEIKLAQLSKNGHIKLIQTKKTRNPEVRVFMKPLNPLREEDIKSAWDGSSDVSIPIDSIVKGVHDRTGHSLEDIIQFIKDLDSAKISGDSFWWKA